MSEPAFKPASKPESGPGTASACRSELGHRRERSYACDGEPGSGRRRGRIRGRGSGSVRESELAFAMYDSISDRASGLHLCLNLDLNLELHLGSCVDVNLAFSSLGVNVNVPMSVNVANERRRELGRESKCRSGRDMTVHLIVDLPVYLSLCI